MGFKITKWVFKNSLKTKNWFIGPFQKKNCTFFLIAIILLQNTASIKLRIPGAKGRPSDQPNMAQENSRFCQQQRSMTKGKKGSSISKVGPFFISRWRQIQPNPVILSHTDLSHAYASSEADMTKGFFLRERKKRKKHAWNLTTSATQRAKKVSFETWNFFAIDPRLSNHS